MGFAQPLITCCEDAVKNKEAGRYGKDDIDRLYNEARKLFDSDRHLDVKELKQLAKLLSDLTDGRVNRGACMKKLQGTSRAEAMRGTLMNNL